MLWSHVRAMMALKRNKSSTTKNRTFWWLDQPVRVIQCLPMKFLWLHWIQIVSTLGFSGQMVGDPFSYWATSARGHLSYPDRLKLFLHRTHLSLASRSRHLCVVVGPGWCLLEERWLCHLLGVHLHSTSYTGWSWPTPLWRPREAIFVFFVWNCISHQRGPRECSWWQL